LNFKRQDTFDDAQLGRWKLRQQNTELPIGIKGVVIGRSSSCEIALDDPDVSRRHARLTAGEGGVRLEDLGSVNGVYVRGMRLSAPRTLRDGDTFSVGRHEFTVVWRATPSDARSLTGRRRNVQTAPVDQDVEDDSYSTTRTDALELMAAVAEKAFAMGNAAQAEEFLSGQLHELLRENRVRSGPVDTAFRYGAKLARATKKAEWVEYVFKLGRAARSPPPRETVVDLLALAKDGMPPFDLSLLREYRAALQVAGTRDQAALDALRELERVALGRSR
jgi:predicted component of type VI protein secretion system